MSVNTEAYQQIISELKEQKVDLVAVSKLKSVYDIKKLYELGQRDFGENYVQELLAKQNDLPFDIRWHFIGHLQANKVKYIAPFIHLIHAVEKESLLKEINKEARKNDRVIDVLLQLFIAEEETKFGLSEEEFDLIMGRKSLYPNVNIIGIMGMASFSENKDQLRKEFRFLKSVLEKHRSSGLKVISTGMSNDYKLAIEEGSNMVRIGSLLFGQRG